MYQRYYGLRELPFDLTPNPRFLYLAPQHREALSNLQYGLSTAKAMTVLIGEAGSGKTTLLHTALQSEMCRQVTCVYLNNPTLTRQEFSQILSERFDLGPRAARSKAVLLSELQRLLAERREHGNITALVIDEAQSLSSELLEEIRLLANIETTTQKLLPLVIAGQPELRDRLNEPRLRQLKQRVSLRCEIAPLNIDHTSGYIAFRIRAAGGDASKIFTREAVTMIHSKSCGIPRVISVICDNALVSGFALGRATVDSAIVAEVVRDFDLDVGASGAVASDGRDGRPAPPAPVVERQDPQALQNGPGENGPRLFATAAGRRGFSLFRG